MEPPTGPEDLASLISGDLLTRMLTNFVAQDDTAAHSEPLDITEPCSSGLGSLLDTVEARGSRPLAPTIGNVYVARFCGVIRFLGRATEGFC